MGLGTGDGREEEDCRRGERPVRFTVGGGLPARTETGEILIEGGIVGEIYIRATGIGSVSRQVGGGRRGAALAVPVSGLV